LTFILQSDAMGIGSSRKSAATYFINILFFVLLRTLNGRIASISSVPQGSNPLLYQPGIDHIVLVFKGILIKSLVILDFWIKTLFLILFLSQAEGTLLLLSFMRIGK